MYAMNVLGMLNTNPDYWNFLKLVPRFSGLSSRDALRFMLNEIRAIHLYEIFLKLQIKVSLCTDPVAPTQRGRSWSAQAVY